MADMRAKMYIQNVTPLPAEGQATSEQIRMHGVSKSEPYPADGSDENNTFAKFSPSVTLDITIANPALIGKFGIGDTFYVDFTKIAK